MDIIFTTKPIKPTNCSLIILLYIWSVIHWYSSPGSWQPIETNKTRTTRTPVFWVYSPPPHDYPNYWVILDPKSNEKKVKVTNWKNLTKLHIFLILKQTLYVAHCLQLLDKMCKFEMILMSIVEDTGQTRFCPQTDRQTDGWMDWQMDKVKPVYPPFNFLAVGCKFNENQLVTHGSYPSFMIIPLFVN